MSQNILFIGGAGFIGSNLIKELLRFNSGEWSVHIIEPPFANISRLDGMNLHIYKGYLSDFDFIKNIIESKCITTSIHLVSTMVPGSSYEDYKLEFENVIFPTVRLMQLCSQKNIKFIYFSSGGTVYGDRKTVVPFLESDAKKPISYYGLSKLTIEESVLFEHRTSGLQYLILRPSNPYGHGQYLYGKQGLIAVSLGRILSNQPITVWGDGASIRDYIYIDDLTQIFRILLEKDICNEIINIGSGIGTSVNDIIDILKEIVEEDVKVEYVESRKSDVSNMILDISKLKSIIPDLRITEMHEGINRFYLSEKKKIN